MIPKIIHYCWFGRGKMPDSALKCIESWKKYCPDYQLIRWDESNFDLSKFPYALEAYRSKKFAFVTDVVRLYALVNFGGVYMDTDVEVLSSLDPFLEDRAFSGFESLTQVPTGIMASEKGFPLFNFFLSSYSCRHFVKEDGTLDMTTNVDSITCELLKRGLKPNNQRQTIEGFTLFPKDYFCPLNGSGQGKPNFSKNTVCIHHFAGSWISPRNRFHRRVSSILRKLFGEKFVRKISSARKKNK